LGIAHLLSTKIEENIWKAELLLAYRHQDFDRIHQYTTLLFGEFDTAVLEIAKELTKTYHPAPASLR
jgi:hypothetical protein